ncbi:uncharacterized protein LOC135385426 [Ornithodoros turicata]|uniref:uncharacterized protein LOC135385426 n=1 Tax=Ornithodoros turicata TaxID=34597 RepID=UPI0031396359
MSQLTRLATHYMGQFKSLKRKYEKLTEDAKKLYRNYGALKKENADLKLRLARREQERTSAPISHPATFSIAPVSVPQATRPSAKHVTPKRDRMTFPDRQTNASFTPASRTASMLSNMALGSQQWGDVSTPLTQRYHGHYRVQTCSTESSVPGSARPDRYDRSSSLGGGRSAAFRTPENDFVPRSRGRTVSSSHSSNDSRTLTTSPCIRLLHTPYSSSIRRQQAAVPPSPRE